MLFICNKCGTKPKADWSFRVAKEDAIGFAFLLIVLGCAIGFWASIFSMLEIGIFGPVFGALAFLVIFFRMGKPVFRFFSFFVDYEFKLKVKCATCNHVYKDIHIPKNDDY